MKKGIKETFEVAGLGVGLGIIGDKLGSAPLQQGGQAAANFVPVMANLSGGLITIDMLKSLKNER